MQLALLSLYTKTIMLSAEWLLLGGSQFPPSIDACVLEEAQTDQSEGVFSPSGHIRCEDYTNTSCHGNALL